MEASTDVASLGASGVEPPSGKRRGRYVREKSPVGMFQPTGRQWRLLRWIAAYRILSVPQLALLAGRVPHTVLQQLRGLFDAGLIEVVPANRSALSGPEEPDDASLLFGSAPNIYVPTRRGLTLLLDRGLIREEEAQRPGYTFGPRSSLALPHTLFIRDVRIWLERTKANYGGEHEVLRWHDGGDAKLDLKRTETPLLVVPDAWFIYQLRGGESPRVLVGLVECDRGTERGLLRWHEKLTSYRLLLNGPRLKEITKYGKARVLVLTLDSGRRDQLVTVIEEFDQTRNLSGSLAQRFWLADKTALVKEGFTSVCWRNPGTASLQSFLAPELL
jgi:Replication-relaxation